MCHSLHVHLHDLATPRPLGVPDRGVQFKAYSRTTAHGGACHLPRDVPSIFGSIDAAVRSMQHYTQRLLEEDGKLYGAEGMNAGMRQIFMQTAVCFNFEVLTLVAPATPEKQAFRN